MAEAAQDSTNSGRAAPRGGLKALSVIVIVLALVGSVVSLVLLFSDDIVHSMSQSSGHRGEGTPDQNYRELIRTQSPMRVAELLMGDALRQVDYTHYTKRAPWSVLRLSMGLRLLSYAAVVLGGILTFARRRAGPRLMLTASLVLVLHGAFEALSLLVHGQFMAAEFYRDLRVTYLEIVEGAGIADEFRDPFVAFEARDATVLRLIGAGYFVVATVFWQLAALCLGGSRPFETAASLASRELSEG